MSIQPPQPEPLPVEVDALPSALTERDAWVCWKYVWKPDREEWTKLPLDPAAGDTASSTGPETWSSFETAAEHHTAGETDGVGYVVSENDRVVGIDLDDCVDPDTGEIEPWARGVVETVPTYWEYSPSGTGLRGFGFGFLPDGKTRSDVEGTDGHIEMYETGRYLTLTGAALDQSTPDVAQVGSEIHDIHAEYISEETDSPETDTRTDGTNPTPNTDETGSSGLSDAEIVQKAEDAENGDKFQQLWNGDTSGYPSHSEADLALCVQLAFWTGGDRTQIDRLFRDSGLYRDKWDEQRGSETYGEITISEAVKRQSEFYDPKQGRSDPSDRPDKPQSDGQTPALDSFTVKVFAGLGEDGDVSDLTDREKAAVVADLVDRRDDLHVRVRRDNRTLWSCDDGVWKPEGERELKHAARKALGSMNYGQNVSQELKAQARARIEWEVEPDTFGMTPGLLPVENGAVFLHAAGDGAGDAALRELEPEDYALARLPVAYDPDATYVEWHSLVEEWAEDGMADALQEYVGYCLHTNALPLDRALLLVGTGANGKSTFLHVVRALLGEENTTSIGLQTLTNEKDAVAEFYGSLANIDDDLSSRKLGSGLGMFKKLTAGDRVRARRLYEDGFEFQATGKHLYAANQVPQVDKVDDEDEAFWRRWLLVEFPNHYPPSDRDPSLRDRFTEPEALSGVLNWAIDGWARLLEQEHFTNEEQYAHDKRTRWQKWGDSVDEFISDCVENDPDADRISTAAAHQRYKAWCAAKGKDPVAQEQFTNKLKQESVGYKQSVRIPKSGGTVKRGYKELGFSEEVPAVSTEEDRDDERDDGQQSII